MSQDRIEKRDTVPSGWVMLPVVPCLKGPDSSAPCTVASHRDQCLGLIQSCQMVWAGALVFAEKLQMCMVSLSVLLNVHQV